MLTCVDCGNDRMLFRDADSPLRCVDLVECGSRQMTNALESHARELHAQLEGRRGLSADEEQAGEATGQEGVERYPFVERTFRARTEGLEQVPAR